MIVMGRRGSKFQIYITKLLEKFNNPTLHMVAQDFGAVKSCVAIKSNDFCFKRCHLMGQCTNEVGGVTT